MGVGFICLKVRNISLLFKLQYNAGSVADERFSYYFISLSGGGSTTVAPVHDGYVLQKVFVINESNRIHLSCN